MKNLSVAFIGLGQMGKPMAKRLVKGGYKLNVYDKEQKPLDELHDEGANITLSPREAAKISDVVVSMLLDDKQTQEVFYGENGVLAGLNKGTIIIMSTLSPTFVQELANKFKREKGIELLDAPVSGGVLKAEDGTLGIMVGGNEQTFQQFQQFLGKMGNNVFYCGPSGSGSLVKLINNSILSAVIAGTFEGIELGLTSGFELNFLLNLFTKTSAKNSVIERWDFIYDIMKENPAHTLNKDLRLVLDYAKDKGVKMPITSFCSELDLFKR